MYELRQLSTTTGLRADTGLDLNYSKTFSSKHRVKNMYNIFPLIQEMLYIY